MKPLVTALALALALQLGAQSPPGAAARPATQPSAAPPASRTPAVPNPRDLKYPPLRPIPALNIESITLPNGMKVYLMEDHDLPVVAGTALVRTGTSLDPPDKIGLAALTGTAMRSGGTAAKTGEQLDEQLDKIAATVETGVNESSGLVTFYTLKESLAEVLEVFRDVLTAPQFRQDKVELARNQMSAAIARRNDDAAALARREFLGAIYGLDSPYGWRSDPVLLNGISRSDVTAFYRRYFFPANVILSVHGDFSAAELKARIQSLFSGWKEEQPAPPPFPKVTAKSAAGVRLVDRRDLTQSFFYIGHLGGEVKDPDLVPLEVMGAILGGGTDGRLQRKPHTSLPVPKISAGWNASLEHAGVFQIAGSTKSESTVAVLKAVLDEVERLHKAEITDEELKTAKDAALNNMVFGVDTRAKALNRFLSFEYHRYPKDFSDQVKKALAAVTKADVARVARERLDPAQLSIVVVGNSAAFEEDLQTLGRSVSRIDPVVTRPAPPVTKANIANTEDTRARGSRILARAQEAAGGAAKLEAVRDFTQIQDFKLSQAAGGSQVTATDRWLAPGYFREESVKSQGRLILYYDGQVGRVTSFEGTFPATAVQIKQAKGDIFRLYFRLLLSDRIEGRTLNAVDENTVEIRDASGETVTLSVDAQTGLPARISYEILTSDGQSTPLQEVFTGFRQVAGIEFPERSTILQRGQKFADVVLVDLRVNTGLKPEELQSVK